MSLLAWRRTGRKRDQGPCLPWLVGCLRQGEVGAFLMLYVAVIIFIGTALFGAPLQGRLGARLVLQSFFNPAPNRLKGPLPTDQWLGSAKKSRSLLHLRHNEGKGRLGGYQVEGNKNDCLMSARDGM